MKARLYFMLLMVLLMPVAAGLTACDSDKDDPRVEISLDSDRIYMVMGTTQTLTATLVPESVPASALGWMSANEEVATVAAGVVTAVSPGKTVIRAQLGSNSAYCEVTVTDVPVEAESVSLNKTELSVPVGHTETLRATVEPENATDRKVTWSSSDESVVSVDEQTGAITALKIGRAVITATTNSGGLTAGCQVAVVPSIELLSPDMDGGSTLDAGSRDAVISFLWTCDVAEVSDFTLELDFTPDFSSPAYSVNTTSRNFDLSHYDLNEIVKSRSEDRVDLYWTVKPTVDPEAAFTSVRRLTVTPDRHEYLHLDQAGATGATVTKLAAAYDYSISVTADPATVTTLPLAGPLREDMTILSLTYSSNQPLTELTVHLKTGGTTLRSILADLPPSAAMSEARLVMADLPVGWGRPGDYVEFDFGAATGYSVELNALHFTEMTDDEARANYTPEKWIISGISNSDILDGGPGFDYVSLMARQMDPERPQYADPSINFETKTCRFPAGATILRFEYRSPVNATARLRLFLWGEHLGTTVTADHGAAYYDDLLPAAGDWTEYSIDFSELRGNLGWGNYHGVWYMRWDPADVVGYRIDVRNFRIEMRP